MKFKIGEVDTNICVRQGGFFLFSIQETLEMDGPIQNYNILLGRILG